MRLKRRRPLLQQRPQKTKQFVNELYHKNTFQNKFKSKRFKENKLTTLLNPRSFYKREFPEIEGDGEWVKVHCCFHDDNNPSLSINLIHGGFKCFACGASGSGIVKFYIDRYGFSFSEAMTRIGGGL
ncbi:MAG: hypothetical protein ACI9UO_001605 [Nitrospinales bacterium]|jgi:hypothetical protein